MVEKQWRQDYATEERSIKGHFIFHSSSLFQLQTFQFIYFFPRIATLKCQNYDFSKIFQHTVDSKKMCHYHFCKTPKSYIIHCSFLLKWTHSKTPTIYIPFRTGSQVIITNYWLIDSFSHSSLHNTVMTSTSFCVLCIWFVTKCKHICTTFYTSFYSFSVEVNLLGSTPSTALLCSGTSPMKHKSIKELKRLVEAS